MERQSHVDFKDIYEHLAKSLAPEIFGMDDVKKSLLLLMGKYKNYNFFKNLIFNKLNF